MSTSCMFFKWHVFLDLQYPNTVNNPPWSKPGTVEDGQNIQALAVAYRSNF